MEGRWPDKKLTSFQWAQHFALCMEAVCFVKDLEYSNIKQHVYLALLLEGIKTTRNAFLCVFHLFLVRHPETFKASAKCTFHFEWQVVYWNNSFDIQGLLRTMIMKKRCVTFQQHHPHVKVKGFFRM